MNKRKLLTLALTLSMVAILAIGGTLAYFTDYEQAENVFTLGEVDILLTEPNWNSTGSEDAPEVYPGESLAKDPTITNDGKNPCFVRINVTGLDMFGANNMITYLTEYVEGDLGTDWVKNEADGYFYYTKPLAVGATTDALFDQIKIPATIDNSIIDAYENIEELKVIVQAQAVQAQGAKPSWSAVENMTVEEIAAWFTTCGFASF